MSETPDIWKADGLRTQARSRFSHRWTVASVLVGITLLAAIWAQVPGSTPGAAVPVGTPVIGILECGEGYTSHELYDIKITLLEVLRGEADWRRIQHGASSGSDSPETAYVPAAEGTENLLAHVRFEYHARGIPGTCIHPLRPDQFTSYSREGENYPAAAIPSSLPAMRGEVKSGDVIEGWIAFLVSESDAAPLMSFSADRGGAVQHGEPKWFLLH